MVPLARPLHPHPHLRIGHTRQRCLLKRLLSKVAASIADQGVASSTNFLLNVFLARSLLPREYGAYSVCWSILIVLAAFHNALILEPMTVVGPAEYKANLNSYLRSAQRINWPVILTLAFLCLPIALVYNQPAVRPALLVLSVSLPGYLLLLSARRKQYVLNQPIRALQLSLLYAALVFVFILICRITGNLSVITGIASLGLSWFAVIGLLAKSHHDPVDVKQLVTRHWHYGKWLFASAILAIGVSDTQTILLSMLVDLKSAGALRALMNFVLPLSQLLTVLSVYALPRLSVRASEWGRTKLLKKGLLWVAAMTVLVAVYLGVLVLLGPKLEHLLYGGKMQSYIRWLPLLAASAFVGALGASFSTLLRAIQNSQHQFIAGFSGTVVAVAFSLYLLRDFGIAGALWSMLAGSSVSTCIIISTYCWLLRRTHA